MTGDRSVRPVDPGEIDVLAQLWHQGWRDAHAKIASPGWTAARTLPSFRDRLVAAIAETRAAGPIGAPAGLCMLKDDELNQLYVTRAARGSGVAAALIDDGEARLAARGVTTAWLACAIGNDRAARFYEKRGWYRARTDVNTLETPDGVLEMPIWRYEKQVRA
jgi:GNAT superfamily N-acetyltransferase